MYRFFQDSFTGQIRRRNREAYLEELPKAPGLMEYIGKASEIYRSAMPDGGLDEARADLSEACRIYEQIRHHKENDFESLVLPVDGQPNLNLLKAGAEGGDYSDRVRDFKWDDFYHKYGSFFTHFREHLMEDYDYILIDSRTGLTDTSGICTRVMPEKMVGVFAPNFQNIFGLKNVIRQSEQYRRNATDSRTLVVFPLASRIASGAEKLRKIWWKGGEVGEDQTFDGYQAVFQDLFKELYQLDNCDLGDYFDATQIPHDNDYAFGEKVAARVDVQSTDKLSIGTACTNFTERLVRLDAPWESLTSEAKLTEAKRQVEEKQTIVFKLESKQATWQRISYAAVIITLLTLLFSSSSVRSFFSKLIGSVVSPSTNSSPAIPSPTPFGGGNFNGGGSPPTTAPRITATALSTRVSLMGNNYDAANAIDGLKSTAWIEGADGPGIGEWIRVDFDREVSLRDVTVMPGYFKDRQYWAQNNRVAQLHAEFSDGSSRDLSFVDVMEPQKIDLGGVRASWVLFKIQKVFTGKFSNTAISELYFEWDP
ncbi:MAG TPA: discoidin domain-containing protein [Pyrinomonadaceae bacterium]|nr:discoidin domain-containing protein [Pyrinomonadaceae bacterium]